MRHTQSICMAICELCANVCVCLAWQACESDRAHSQFSLCFSSIVCHNLIICCVCVCVRTSIYAGYSFFRSLHCTACFFSSSSSTQFKPKINDSFWRVRYFFIHQRALAFVRFCQATQIHTFSTRYNTFDLFRTARKKIQLTELNGFSFSLKFIFLLLPFIHHQRFQRRYFLSIFHLIAYNFVMPWTIHDFGSNQTQSHNNRYDYAQSCERRKYTVYITHITLYTV